MTRQSQIIIKAADRCFTEEKLVSELSKHCSSFFDIYIERVDKASKNLDNRSVTNITKQFDAMFIEKVTSMTISALAQDGHSDITSDMVRALIGGKVRDYKTFLYEASPFNAFFRCLVTDVVNNKFATTHTGQVYATRDYTISFEVENELYAQDGVHVQCHVYVVCR